MRDGEQSALECMYISDYFVFKNMEILLFFSFKCKFKYNNYFLYLTIENKLESRVSITILADSPCLF